MLIPRDMTTGEENDNVHEKFPLNGQPFWIILFPKVTKVKREKEMEQRIKRKQGKRKKEND